MEKTYYFDFNNSPFRIPYDYLGIKMYEWGFILKNNKSAFNFGTERFIINNYGTQYELLNAREKYSMYCRNDTYYYEL